jgi:hypothetical protein
MVIRKNPQQIKEEILSNLSKGPLSIDQLRKKLDSNWSTTSYYLEELSKEEKVREIISSDKAKVYQKIYGDTYFDLPLTDIERKKFRTLFNLILREYKLKEKVPTKTCFAKCAVQVIKDESSGLSDLPIIWYLYGLIPQMIADPSLEYAEEIEFENKSKIRHIIVNFIDKTKNMSSGEIQKEQHKEYGEELYILADSFFEVLNKKEWKNEAILNILNKFFIACPVDNEFPEIFDLTERVLSLINKIGLIGIELQDYRKEILLSFDSLWKLIALYKLYQSKIKGKNAMNKEILLKFYIGNVFESRKTILKENILELNSIYSNNLEKFDINKIKLPDELHEINKIMEDWTGGD